MKLSVIIPYYNAEKYIGKLLDALLQQGFQSEEYEILVIDDGSTHDIQIVKEYCNKHNSIKYYHQNNAGVSAARNTGIKVARGEYLFFCDSDDMVIENVFEKIYKAARGSQLDVLFFNRIILNENEVYSAKLENNTGELSQICSGKDFYARNPRIPTGPWHYIVRRELVESHGLKFPSNAFNVEDVSFLYDIFCVAEYASKIELDGYLWIQHNESATHDLPRNKALAYCNAFVWIIKKGVALIDGEQNNGFVDALNNRIASHSLIMLHNSFMYLKPADTKLYVQELRKLGRYPFPLGKFYSDRPFKVKFLHYIMNKYMLWMTLSCARSLIKSLMPQK